MQSVSPMCRGVHVRARISSLSNWLSQGGTGNEIRVEANLQQQGVVAQTAFTTPAGINAPAAFLRRPFLPLARS
jgi:hypothetical protein